MGIPKFFRYISGRYPCISQVIDEYMMPEFDNLYLDTNGIVHVCSHPSDDVEFRITEETIFANIFRYIELLFRMIQPQKLFFLAVDGVAPRAKINHQRSRRFRSAKAAEVQEAQAKAKGVILPTEKKFDPNCITPGTLFMAKLNKLLKYFITYKVSTDRLWQRCKVIYSGSEVPGEGEHKIMDYIRYLKSQPDYDVHTRHCLYGLDADLIMLGLCTHELQFSLLREVVVFGKAENRKTTPEETKFCLLHISLLREYIDLEFSPLKETLPFPYDLEKIIDDWVLMSCLVGNDFIPHLPNFVNLHCALPILSCAYTEVLPTLGGYINEAGTLRLDRFEQFMKKLSLMEIEQFSEQLMDIKYFESKTGRRPNESERHSYKKSDDAPDEPPVSPKKINKDLDALIKSTAVMSIGDFDEEEDESDTDTYNMEFVQHKRDYYMNKFQYANVDAEFLRSQAEGYVRAIQWNLYYYYDGCRSWSWYYPHHYAPYISDIKDFKDTQLEFQLEQPFLPFEQLLAVLPPQSKELLPEAFQGLVTEQESPIINYYPESFYTDLNGKRQEWEAVVLLPFIDDKDLTSAMGPHYEKLSDEEKERNNHGPMCVYTYTPEKIGTCQATYYYPEIANHALLQLVNHEDIIVPREKLVKGLSPGVKRETYYPGFPTFRHLEYTASLEKVKLQNQLMISGSSMILRLKPREELSLWTVASQYLSQVVYVNWPYLREAQVVGVSDGVNKYSLINPQMNFCTENVTVEHLRGSLASQWQAQRKNIAEVYKTRLGIEIGEPCILVHARPLVGKRYMFGSHGKLNMERQWADTPQTFAYQVVVKDITVYSPSTQIYKSVSDVFKPRTVCFMLGHPYYGAMGHVPEVDANEKSGRIKVWMSVMPSPVLDSLKQKHAITKTHYMEGAIVAQKLGINSHLLSRITGTIYVMQVAGENQEKLLKRNVGLNLKFNKKNLEVPGYTRKENGQWLYSSKTLELVRNYILKNPALFERLAKQRADILQESDLFDEKTGSLSDTMAWLEEQLKGIESCPTGTETLEPSLIQEMEQLLTVHTKVQANSKKVVLMYVKPHLLYVPSLEMRSIAPDPKAQHRLFDRVCCVKDCFSVPLGHKGVIIGIQKDEDKTSSMYNVLFDEPFPGGISLNGCTEGRAYRLGHCDFVNISHGERLEHRKGVDTPTAVNHMNQNRNTIFYSPRKENNSGQVNKEQSAGPVMVKRNNGHKSNEIRLAPDVRPWVRNDSKEENQKPEDEWKNQQQDNQVTAVKPSFEFQALWNELHEKTNQPREPQKVPRNPVSANVRTPNKVNASPVQDPSAVLKAILKIPNGNEQEHTEQGPSKTQPQKPTANTEKQMDAPPPLVKQLFDQARQNEKGKNDKGSVRYCLLLLHHYQITGAGMPRYSYFTDKGTNLIQANILLPDSRVFVGDPCVNHEQAAESAAKKVCTELNIGGMRPDVKNLLPPPIQWRNNAWRQEVRPPQVLPGFMPKMQPPQPYHSFIAKMAPKPQFPPPPPPQQHTPQQQQQQHNNQFRPQPEQSQHEPKVNKSTAFVPLQAQKKSRKVVAKQEKKTVNQSPKDGSAKVLRHQSGEQTSKRPDSERTADTSTKQAVAQHGPENTKNPQPTPKSQSEKPKRSRVAAKFGMQVQPQESTSQNNSGVK